MVKSRATDSLSAILADINAAEQPCPASIFVDQTIPLHLSALHTLRDEPRYFLGLQTRYVQH